MKELKLLMKEEGYTNKAEFFRFLMKFFKYHRSPERIALEKETKELANVLKKLNSKGLLNKSLEEQLDEI